VAPIRNLDTSSNQMLTYNTQTKEINHSTPHCLSLNFPRNDPFNVGSTNFTVSTITNVGPLTYNILSLNDTNRTEASTVFRITGFSNNIYNISSTFTFIKNTSGDDLSFRLSIIKTSLSGSTTPDFWVNVSTNDILIDTRDNAPYTGCGSTTSNVICDFRSGVSNVEIRYTNYNGVPTEITKFLQYGSCINIFKMY
jgi:hypothetical protein